MIRGGGFMGKQNEYRFNLKFDEIDEDHRRVSDFLNSCGRKKARYVVKAMLAYWALQDGECPVAAQPAEREMRKSEDVRANAGEGITEKKRNRLVQVGSGGTEEMDQEEAELMMQNYAMFDDME